MGQFGFLFVALQVGMTAALASVLMQTQVFFTASMGAVLLRERIVRPLKVGPGRAGSRWCCSGGWRPAWPYALWTGLLKKFPASRVAPFSLGVPVIGLLAGIFLLGEQVAPLQWAGAALVLCALACVLFGDRLLKSRRAVAPLAGAVPGSRRRRRP